jgi:hypothetical protein
MAAQRKAIEIIQRLGEKLDSKAVGYTIGDVAAKNVTTGTPITTELVQETLSNASSLFGN